jgi:MFS family permease
MVAGFAACGIGWTLAAVAPASAFGIAAFAAMLMLFGVGAVLIFITFLSLRQAVTPAPLLGRMTSTMRWLILLPAAPGALIGGWLGEHLGLRAALAAGGPRCCLPAQSISRHPPGTRVLPPTVKADRPIDRDDEFPWTCGARLLERSGASASGTAHDRDAQAPAAAAESVIEVGRSLQHQHAALRRPGSSRCRHDPRKRASC